MMKDLSMHVMDIAQNSVRAEAKLVTIEINEDRTADCLTIAISDDGKGMTPEILARVRDPFVTSRTTRSVGLGLPMLEQTCQMCGGSLGIESELGVGTVIKAAMGLTHIDRPPMGDMDEAARLLILSNEGMEFVYRRVIDGKAFELDTREVKAALDGVPLNTPDVMAWLRDFIEEGVAELAGV